MSKEEDFIECMYDDIPMADFKAVEKAIGFKLLFWQKTYICFGEFRRTGRTTAEALRRLLRSNKDIIAIVATNPREYHEAQTMQELSFKLRENGIKVPVVDIRKF